MTRRFSSRQLTYLRNQVPISRIIEALPELAARRGEKLHFECPLCHGFNTSINLESNLARCFDCRKNFNPIEMVMHQLQISFVESVNWLMQRMSTKLAVDTSTTDRRSTQPTAVGDILTGMVAAVAETKSNTNSESIPQRLSILEKKVSHLYQLINELRSSLNLK